MFTRKGDGPCTPFRLSIGDKEKEDGPSFGSLMFSPRIEVPFNPDSRAMFGALVGIDFRRFTSRRRPTTSSGSTTTSRR